MLLLCAAELGHDRQHPTHLRTFKVFKPVTVWHRIMGLKEGVWVFFFVCFWIFFLFFFF